jgi:hypothetical protein
MDGGLSVIAHSAAADGTAALVSIVPLRSRQAFTVEAW